jgi:hypothetical protein
MGKKDKHLFPPHAAGNGSQETFFF